MVYITGDTHGDFNRFKCFTKSAQPTSKDVMIILGDVALNYFDDKRDEGRKQFVSSFPFTTFCIHGNHELRPEHVTSYQTKEWHGGAVWYEPEYPNILFAVDGEVYDFGGRSCIVIGGAYSVDKQYRLDWGYRWFEDEQPSDEIKACVEKQLEDRGWKIDTVLSHTCPIKYMPTESLMKGLDQSTVDMSTEEWLDTIEDRLNYREWYCGHFHTAKTVDRIRFMYKDIALL